MKIQEKPKVVEQIEKFWDENFELYPAPKHPTLLDGLMAFKADWPKYALDEEGRLIGLNLAATGLDDRRWQEIRQLLEANQVRLRALNLSENQLRQLAFPAGIETLEALDVDDNPIGNLPKQLAEQGNAAILNFFKQIEEQEGAVALHEAKLLIVGEPGAGKTTLLEKLKNPDYIAPTKGDPEIKSTVGINIYEGWDFIIHENDEEIQFKANLWDFGGQEIQYMTHHFFLTPRALYVLVADDRKQNTEFDYWFRIINLLGRESEEEKIRVLVVLNEINHVSVSNFSLGKYRQAYPGMDIQMQEIDFSINDTRGDTLVRTIQELLFKLPHIGDQLPRLWIPIREDLLKIRVKQPHISFAEFAAVCSQERNGKRLQREEDQRYLSRYLHRLGVMLHYQDDDFLDNFVILNPQWAVDAVYSVLKDKRVVENHGRFTQEDLKEFWKDYSRDERSRLLSLMLKDRFEICYPSTNRDEYIAPQLLSNERPAFDWDSAGAMKFRYQYPFMPKGLISRLIVRLSDDIASGGELVWNEGVVVERNSCQAQVVQKKTVKEGLEVLEIELCGAKHERKFLLRHIMTEVEKIHEKSFKHIAFERMIPCICEYCQGTEDPTFFEYSELIQYQEENWGQIDCRKGKLKKVPVKTLLEGVFEEGELIQKIDLKAGALPELHIHNTIEIGKSNPVDEAQRREKQEHDDKRSEDKTAVNNNWWIPRLIGAVLVGLVIAYLFNKYLKFHFFDTWLAFFSIIAIVLLLRNPNRRYFRVGYAALGMLGIVNILPQFDILINSRTEAAEGAREWFFQLGIQDAPWISVALVVLAGYLFYLDSKKG